MLEKRRTWFSCGVLLFLGLIAAGCSSNAASSPAAPTTLRIGVPEGAVRGTELGVQNLAARLAVEGLTLVGEDGRALPNLAEGWSWEANGQRLRIRLRQGVTFHDGTPFTAQLAAELVNEAVQRPSNRVLFTSLADIKSIRPEGTGELIIELAQPSAFLPEDLELPLALGPDRIGTGAYRLVSREPSQTVMERFDRYHGGTPSIQQVVFQSTSMRTAWASLLRGEVDMVTEVPPDAVQFIKNDEVAVIPFNRRYQYLIALNSRRAPFNNGLVRRALNYAVDRQAILDEIMQGQGQPSTGPLWPKHWAYDNSIPPYAFDQSLATSLLDAAGLKTERRVGQANARFRFTCLIPANFAIIERLALVVQRQLYNVGVDMQFEVVPIEEFDTRVREGRFEAMLIDLAGGPTFGRSYLFWASRTKLQGLNVFGYENAETERLFGVLRRSTNELAVRSATSNLQRSLLEDPPAVFLVWVERSRAVRRDFQVVGEPGRDPLFTIGRWKTGAPAGTTQ